MAQIPTDPREVERYIHNRLQNDLAFFCRKALTIKTKSGQLVPFEFNRAQEYLHAELEKMKADTGRVRALVIKGRQQGVSTYIAARYYHRATRNPGTSVFILSHLSDTTEALFQMVERYHENCPKAIKPKDTTNNRRRIIFENSSQYSVGTAGSGAIGRGSTHQLFHGSEVSHYENTDDLQTGALQTVADVDNTEIILESTANGVGNYFHQAVMDAMEDKGRFRVIFIPWYWQPEYTEAPPASFHATEEELQLQNMYNLTAGQLYWRRLKIQDFGSDWKFKQEYPFTVKEAFQTSGNSLIDPMLLQKARKTQLTDKHAAKVLGVDPARKGDRTVLVYRQGRHMHKVDTYEDMDEMRLAGIISNYIDKHQIDKCFIDVGMGYGTVDRLKELGYQREVTGVHFGERATEKGIYLNKRAEMAINLRDWFAEGDVSIPDSELIETDLLAVPDYKETSSGMIQLESKDSIKKTYGKSPDIFDAACLTFAYPVRASKTQRDQTKKTKSSKKGSPLRSRARMMRRHKVY